MPREELGHAACGGLRTLQLQQVADTGEGVSRILAALAARAGVAARVRAHALRHTATTALLDAGAGLREALINNYATHKHPAVRAWLAARPRYDAHYTPTYASWLNQVERWFGHITRRAIRRGSFRTVRELVRRIDTFVQHYNAGARPFAWTATADSILAKLERLLKAISGTAH